MDPDAVERILFNPVDNACKYARDAADRRIHVFARGRGGQAFLTVRDHGPGLPSDARSSLFRPFSKSAARAARTAPGVGLGLALSRRLARAMGGDLRLVKSPTGDRVAGGACFELALPAYSAR